MSKYILRIYSKTWLYYLLIVTSVFGYQAAGAQDLVLENVTIADVQTYNAANSITAGPNFTVSSSGKVFFEAGNIITFKPPFYVVSGGELYASVNFETAIEHSIDSDIPTDITLDPNFPNPFNPSTTIVFNLTQNEDVQLRVLNTLGEVTEILIAKRLSSGKHQFRFDGSDYASGIYYYQLIAGDFQQTRKMILLK